MATNKLIEEEGLLSSLREKYGSVDGALAAHAEGWAGAGAEASVTDESSLREALAGPQHDQIIAILIGLAKAPDGASTMRAARTETVDKDETISIHAEKNQDIEVENDETHVVAGLTARRGVWDDTDIVHVLDDDGPSTLLHIRAEGHGMSPLSGGGIIADIPGHLAGHVGHVAGDWNGDGQDTVGFADADGDSDASDFLL